MRGCSAARTHLAKTGSRLWPHGRHGRTRRLISFEFNGSDQPTVNNANKIGISLVCNVLPDTNTKNSGSCSASGVPPTLDIYETAGNVQITVH
jgi:hypothetical protein